MKKEKKSYLTIKFYGYFIIGSVIALAIEILKWPLYAELILFLLFCIPIILILSLRCERCGSLAYRMNSKNIGLPHPKFYFQPKKCPVCGIERY